MWCGVAASGAVPAAGGAFAGDVVAAPAVPSAVPGRIAPMQAAALPQDAALSLRLGHAFGRALEHVYVLIANQLLYNPRGARVFIGAVLVVLITGGGFMTARPAHAVLLDQIVQAADAQTAGWYGQAMLLGQSLFWCLGAVLVVYNLWTSFIQHGASMRAFALTIVRTSLFLGIPFVAMQAAPASVCGVIDVANQIAGAITGGALGGGACGAGGLQPDAIIAQGSTMSWTMVQHAFAAVTTQRSALNITDTGTYGFAIEQMLVDVVFVVLALLLAIVLVGAFTFIAIELVFAYLQAYFCLPLGVWALGFLATPATANIANGVVSAFIQTIIRFVAILAAVAMAHTVGTSWEQTLNALQFTALQPGAAVDLRVLKTIISITMAALALVYLVVNLPRLASSVLSGHPALTGGTAIASAMPAMGGAAGSGAGAVLGGFAGGVSGMVRGAGTGGIPGMIASGVGGVASGAVGGARSGHARGSAAGRTVHSQTNMGR